MRPDSRPGPASPDLLTGQSDDPFDHVATPVAGNDNVTRSWRSIAVGRPVDKQQISGPQPWFHALAGDETDGILRSQERECLSPDGRWLARGQRTR